jgi:cytochrome P450
MAPSLAHLPHCGHPPILADLRFLRDTLGFLRGVHERRGPVTRIFVFGRPQVLALGAEANERTLFDRDDAWSAAGGWTPLLGELFPGGLILRDGADHRRHRRLMLPAFRRDMLERHRAQMQPIIDAAIGDWLQRGSVEFHGCVKRLTLDIAARVFLGIRLQQEMDTVARDFVDLVLASAALVRYPLPGGAYRRGLQARARLVRYLGEQVDARRRGDDDDLISQLCHARDDDGRPFTDAEVVDHMVFMLMAAHDTTTSALTTVVMALGEQPHLQQHAGGGDGDGDANILREALRLYPPLPTIARMATREVEIDGCRIPAGTRVIVAPLFAQRDPRWWTYPDRFDPGRFRPERAEHRRHPAAWTPFGGGAHMCVGMNFAETQVQAVLQALRERARWTLSPGFRNDYAFLPIGRPRGGLPVRFEAHCTA